jgi:transposase
MRQAAELGPLTEQVFNVHRHADGSAALLAPVPKVAPFFLSAPGRFIRRRHVQEVLRCSCNGHVVTAPGAPKVIEQGRYGASVLAQLIVAKCIDSLPIYRLEKAFAREGMHIKRSTMNELFHKSAAILEPLYKRLLALIAQRELVQADETRLRMLDGGDGTPKNGFVWTFVAADQHGGVDVAYRFAADRSAETAQAVLGGTTGYLVVDGYAGYNRVVDVGGRVRVGCHAHLRRYFHDALPTAPAAQEAIDLILELYRVEHEAEELGCVGTDSHFELRQQKSAPARRRLKAWLDDNAGRQLPKSPIGIAIRYGLKLWIELGRFLDDVRIPLDNNASERALRRVALGRKNFLFVGDAASGENIAGLYSLSATCEARGINPLEYLTDVISRIGEHPSSRLDELLPANWAAVQT